jgi:carbon-monoxide dehydrogenase small subunit
MSERVRLSLDVNGRRHRVNVPPMKRLLDVLREDCGLTGAKEGCGEGECGACSVLMDGRSVCSCLVPAAQAEGVAIVTVEGLARNDTLSALQRAFVEHGAAQCGICTPGMLITSVELLERAKGRVPSDAQVREALAGNLCRCTGYQKIVDAVIAAARARGRGGAARRRGATTGAARKRAAVAAAKRGARR